MSKTDLTFITNEGSQSLRSRFAELIRDTKYFDCLVGYFYSSGFYSLYSSLEQTERIRILIGIGTDKHTHALINTAQQNGNQMLFITPNEAKEWYESKLIDEMENSEDSLQVELGVKKFIDWIKNKKLQIRVYPYQHIHAKLYIMTFQEGDRDAGRVITGSSNFTRSGLSDNIEFNVELKNRADYEFALQKFEELWKQSVDISDIYVQTIRQNTWLNPDITPYHLYLKFLYEYFKDELSRPDGIPLEYVPKNFKRLEYQEQAVYNAKKILEEYGGVFISDVVGLGKTYITAMLASQLDGRTLVIAPPVLLQENNPGSWKNVFSDFRIAADFVSIGKLESLVQRGTDKYKNVIIDEAHRFRNETTKSYEELSKICRGKRVILVTATPYNNTPLDLLNQIKLFQNTHKSTIPNMMDLEYFFRSLDHRLRSLDKGQNYDLYIRVAKANAKKIREKVLKYLMVRRTRREIEKYFSEDLKRQNVRFPEVEAPQPLYYQLNEREDQIFDKTVELITQKFKYTRYSPLLQKYYKGDISENIEQGQQNMRSFMKILLLKRLESSFHAFLCTINRFVESYEIFKREFDNGNVYVSKKHSYKVLNYLREDNTDALERLIEEDKARRYNSEDFTEEFQKDLNNDLQVLNEIQEMWSSIRRDPKLLTLLNQLDNHRILSTHKLIIFTESKDTAEYLTNKINAHFSNKANGSEIALCFTGSSSSSVRDKVIQNFDHNYPNPSDEYRILVTTDVLSEGVNLHRSNVVINYDIPWNPTRMMQRVGRINRVDTPFDRIHTFNFFPTPQANDELRLKEAAEAKIHTFLTLLGGDAALLTEGEPVDSHELFNRLISKNTLIGEDLSDESELKYLQIIKNIRENDPDLFDKIKRLPKKARSAKMHRDDRIGLITYFRKGKLQKFFLTTPDKNTHELDFIQAAKLLQSTPEDKKSSLPKDFYDLLRCNKKAFINITTEEEALPVKKRKGRTNENQLLKILKLVLKNPQQLTEDQEVLLSQVIRKLKEGGLPKTTVKKALAAIKPYIDKTFDPLNITLQVQQTIHDNLLKEHYSEQLHFGDSSNREVILSMYLTTK